MIFILETFLSKLITIIIVQATRAFEYCAREAAMIHGGNAYVKG